MPKLSKVHFSYIIKIKVQILKIY